MHFVRSCIKDRTYDLLWSKDQVTDQLLRPPAKRHADV